MQLRSLLAAASGAAFLIAAAPPAAHPAQATAVQKKEMARLAERLGACHRAHAAAEAKSTASAETIATRAIAACQTQVVPIRALAAKVMGARAADAYLTQQQARWHEAIVRIVAANRAQR